MNKVAKKTFCKKNLIKFFSYIKIMQSSQAKLLIYKFKLNLTLRKVHMNVCSCLPWKWPQKIHKEKKRLECLNRKEKKKVTLPSQFIFNSFYTSCFFNEVIYNFWCFSVFKLCLWDSTHIKKILQFWIQIIQLQQIK